MAILDAVEAGASTFTQISRSTGLTRPTTHRLLKALEAHGLVSSGGSFGYRLGPRILALSVSAARGLPLRELAHPILLELARSTGESTQLYVRDGDKRLCVDAVGSESELRTIVEIGAELPLTAGSAGKVFLAFGSPTDRDQATAAQRLTDRTPVGDELLRQLDQVRRNGFATSSGERQPGVGSVSAPVFGSAGEVLAVVSLSWPEARLGKGDAKGYSVQVRGAARELKAGLGVGSG
jgi:DNA-binding IclR family transcriptional regulator